MYQVISYESVGPLRFGMNEEEVIAAVGQPQSISRGPDGEIGYEYGKLIAHIAPAHGLVEVGFAPVVRVLLEDLDIFSSPRAFEELARKDGSPFEYAGFIILLKLGITLTGFHDGDESGRAVVVFAKGRWDHLCSKLKKYTISK